MERNAQQKQQTNFTTSLNYASAHRNNVCRLKHRRIYEYYNSISMQIVHL